MRLDKITKGMSTGGRGVAGGGEAPAPEEHELQHLEDRQKEVSQNHSEGREAAA